MTLTGGPSDGTTDRGASTTGLRLAIADDSVILRDGMVALLTRSGHEVVLAVGDGESLLEQINRAAAMGALPDVAIVDVRMPPSYTDEGLRAALHLRATHPGVAVLLFSQYVETAFAAKLFAGDARGVGYLLKDRVADVSDFLDALARVASGHTVLDPEVVTHLLGSAGQDEGLQRLTPREREVLTLMAEGRSNGAIAESLVLSYGAVEKHIGSIFAKLDLAPDAGDHRRVLAVLRFLG